MTKQKLGPNQQAWVDVLRSGKYEQCKGTLERSGSFCCLGVLCMVAQGKGPIIRFESNELEGGDLASQWRVREWVKLRSNDGQGQGLTSLMELNDEKGYTFPQIADFIEEHADKLFSEVK